MDRLVVSLMTRETAHWLIDEKAIGLIRELAPYCQGDIREMLRPYTGGLLDAQDATARAYREEGNESGKRRGPDTSRRLRSVFSSKRPCTMLCRCSGNLNRRVLGPDLPEAYRGWLASETSKQLNALDLEKNVRWEGTTLWAPNVLSFLLKVMNHYDMKIEPDEPLVFAITALGSRYGRERYQRAPSVERRFAHKTQATSQSASITPGARRDCAVSRSGRDLVRRDRRKPASDCLGPDRSGLSASRSLEPSCETWHR